MRSIHHSVFKFAALTLGATLATNTSALAETLDIQPAGAMQGISPKAQVITTPKTPEFPGSKITLTQPINTLQPIPPAATKLPSPLN